MGPDTAPAPVDASWFPGPGNLIVTFDTLLVGEKSLDASKWSCEIGGYAYTFGKAKAEDFLVTLSNAVQGSEAPGSTVAYAGGDPLLRSRTGIVAPSFAGFPLDGVKDEGTL